MQRRKKMQGSPAESKKKSKKEIARIVMKVILDLVLVVAIFYAGYQFGHLIFQGMCPDIDLVKQCYVNTNEGIIPIDVWRNITLGG